MPDIVPIAGAAAGGLFPSLAWLWFWLREEAEHPEPRRLIAAAFAAGMLVVALVIPLEEWVAQFMPDMTIIIGAAANGTMYTISAEVFTYLAWSALEEIMKFGAASFFVLRHRKDAEPIDMVIDMVAVALGFAAVENALFLYSPLSGTSLAQIVATGDFRFIGATLLHVFSSAIIGVALGLAFYESWQKKVLYATGGVILAILLHGTFNLLILYTPQAYMLLVFAAVWIGIIALLAVLEYVKRIHPRRSRVIIN